MTIPVSFLWNVPIPLRKKLGLIGIFSMTVFIMIAGIVRVVVGDAVALTDQSWCYAWSAIEMSVGKSYFRLEGIDIHLCHDC